MILNAMFTSCTLLIDYEWLNITKFVINYYSNMFIIIVIITKKGIFNNEQELLVV